MLVERRRNAFSAPLLIRVGIAWLLVSALLLLSRWGVATAGEFPGADDILRLMQVRDLIAGQNWFDVTQYRVDVPHGGIAMHWSRLVDIPIAAVILALSPIIGGPAAQSAALIIVPLATLFVAMLLCVRIAWRLLGEEEATLAALVMAISVPVLFQLGPMRIDHHGWQIVCALAALNGLMARSPRTGGRIAGAALATWVAISIEGLPFAAIVIGVLSLRWLRDRREAPLTVSAMRTFALTGIALFLATRGIGDLATYCDAIGPVHLAIFALGALVYTALARFEPLPRGLVLVGMAGCAGGGLAILMLGAPQCGMSGGFEGLDPLVAQYWHANILEGQPIWRQPVESALQYAVTPLIGLAATLALIRGSHDWLRRFWIDYALILLGAFVISVFIARAGAVACVLAAPPLAWQLRQWLRAIRSMKSPVPRVAAMATLVLALMPAFPALLLTQAIPAAASDGAAPPAAMTGGAARCDLRGIADAMDDLPPGEVFAPLDIAPYILFGEHGVVATSHHRGGEAMRFLIATSLAPPERAGAALRARGTDYVALCLDLVEPQIYRQAAPEGLIAVLLKGERPDWLAPVRMPEDSALRVWRVRASGELGPQ